MNYEALGRYLSAKEEAERTCKARNEALSVLKRWAESACNSDQMVSLDGNIGAQLLAQVQAANELLEASVIAANSSAADAQRPAVSLRTNFFKL